MQAGAANGLAVVAVIVGCIDLALVWAIRRNRLPRNPWIGIRLPALMASDEAWEKGHRAAAGPLLSMAPAGVVLAVGSLFLSGSLSAATALVALLLQFLSLGLAVRAAMRAV